MTIRYTHHCATCDAPIVEPNEHCAKHPHSAIYMSVDIGAPRDACEVLADPPRLNLQPIDSRLHHAAPSIPADSRALPSSPDAASWGSTELDAIRTWVEDDSVCLQPRARDVIRFLLGHVDDLTEERDSELSKRCEANLWWQKKCDALGLETGRERDELRAKLTTVEREYADVAHAVGIAYEADGHPIVPGPVERIIGAIREDRYKAALAEELEAKLADVEKRLLEAGQAFIGATRQAGEANKRTEAAEAEVARFTTLCAQAFNALIRGHLVTAEQLLSAAAPPNGEG